MKLIHIVGNRPQFIKLALLSRELHAAGELEELVIHTGQHFDYNMSDIFFKELPLPTPSYTLGINNLSHSAMIGRMLEQLDPVLEKEHPRGIMVYGDTNTTLAGALAARKRNIPLAHAEAGIRTFDEAMPEESNRYLTDRMAGINFACTYLGIENLQKEGYFTGQISSQVHNTGDLMLDAALFFKDKALEEADVFSTQQLPEKDFILVTIHRAENTSDPQKLQAIAAALNELHRETPVVFPVHPHTRNKLEACGALPHCIIIPPQGYLNMLALVQRAGSVITDSGGLSREAFFFSRPAVIVMEKPFWPEIIEHGNCVAARPAAIVQRWKAVTAAHKTAAVTIFGDGHAAQKINRLTTAYIKGVQ